jgi:hypothetical protein
LLCQWQSILPLTRGQHKDPLRDAESTVEQPVSKLDVVGILAGGEEYALCSNVSVEPIMNFAARHPRMYSLALVMQFRC